MGFGHSRRPERRESLHFSTCTVPTCPAWRGSDGGPRRFTEVVLNEQALRNQSQRGVTTIDQSPDHTRGDPGAPGPRDLGLRNPRRVRRLLADLHHFRAARIRVAGGGAGGDAPDAEASTLGLPYGQPQPPKPGGTPLAGSAPSWDTTNHGGIQREVSEFDSRIPESLERRNGSFIPPRSLCFGGTDLARGRRTGPWRLATRFLERACGTTAITPAPKKLIY